MRRLIYTLISALSITNASAEIIIEKSDGTYISAAEAKFEPYNTDNFTLSGIPVSEIKSVTANPLAQPQAGTVVQMPESCAKPTAILDMNARNRVIEDSEDGRHLYSAEYLMDIAGLPYFTTEALDEAIGGASVILFSGVVGKNTFTDEEYATLIQWVKDGGVIISPAIEHNTGGPGYELFGVEDVHPKSKSHTLIRWTDTPLPELSYIDTEEERDTYIGKNYIFTSSYTPSTAQVLATYDDTDAAAVIKNQIGKGCAYSVGVRWRDVVQRLQLNKGGEHRVGNNHFEPSGDVYPLFVRACHVANSEVAVWKHTIPDGYESVLIPTHDCDSRTALDEMHWMADYEHSLGFNAHYFITVHYFRQKGYLSAFYNEETVPKIADLLKLGHTVGSHSVCHFPDFNVTTKFPMTETTPEEYAANCTYDVDTKSSSGGSTWAEIVMSKQMLEADLNNNVRSFRSGHLCVNNNIPEALVVGDYSFSSCYTATDLWCSFPFFQRKNNTWSGALTDILQMPLHYSDVKPNGETMNEENWQEALGVWYDMHVKLKGNFTPNILLIHPNKEWKMELQKEFIEKLDLETVGLYNFEDYGDFWIKRLEMDYDYILLDGTVTIRINDADLTKYKGQGLFVETKEPLSAIAITNSEDKVHIARIIKISDTRLIAVI